MNNRRRMIVRAKKRYNFYPYNKVSLSNIYELSSVLTKTMQAMTTCIHDLMITANEAVKAFDWSEIAKQMGGIEE